MACSISYLVEITVMLQQLWVELGWVSLTFGCSNASGLLPMVKDSSRRPSQFWSITEEVAPLHCHPRGIICLGTWRALHSRRILHAPSAISVHGGFSQGEPQTLVLRSGVEDSTDRATAPPPQEILEFQKIQYIRGPPNTFQCYKMITRLKIS